MDRALSCHLRESLSILCSLAILSGCAGPLNRHTQSTRPGLSDVARASATPVASSAVALQVSPTATVSPHAEEPSLDSEESSCSRSDSPTAWLEQHHHVLHLGPHASFDDLLFLAPLLDGRTIVQLGESAHGVAEYNTLKVRLVKYLHEELGFGVIAFESSLFACYLANEQVQELAANDTMRMALYPIWQSEEVLELFRYIRETRSTDHPLILAGFDVQTNGQTWENIRPSFLQNAVGVLNPAHAQQVYDLDMAVVKRLQEDREALSLGGFRRFLLEEGAELIVEYEQLVEFFDHNMRDLIVAHPEDPRMPLVARQEAWSWVCYVKQIRATSLRTAAGLAEAYYIRDRGMFENLKFILEALYPEEKVIVWAHNYHVRHDNLAVDMPRGQPPNMGGWLVEEYGPELYTIGFYLHHGEIAWLERVYPVAEHPPDGLETLLHQLGDPAVFVDMAPEGLQNGGTWLSEPIATLTMGTTLETLALSEQYDAILFVDAVHPPIYIW